MFCGLSIQVLTFRTSSLSLFHPFLHQDPLHSGQNLFFRFMVMIVFVSSEDISTSLHLPEFAPLCWLIKRVTKHHLFPETESSEQMQPLKNIVFLFLVRTRNKTGWRFNTIAKNRTQLAGHVPVRKGLPGYRPRPRRRHPGKPGEGGNVAVSSRLFHASK